MLIETFYWLVNMSILGTLTGLAVLLVRKIPKLPRRAVRLLWLVPLYRFWCPVGLTSKLSLLWPLKSFTKTVIVWRDMSGMNSTCLADSYFPVTITKDLPLLIFTVASQIWLSVAVILLAAAVILYTFSRIGARGAKRHSGNIFSSEKLSSPAVYGVFFPKILVPKELIDGDIRYIVLHEKAHIRRCDNLFRVIAILTACLHWFNPFAWLFLKYVFADMELACDESVVRKLSPDERRDYAAALINAAAGRPLFISAFGGAKTKKRVEKILSYKKLSVVSALFAAALLIALAYSLMTNAG